MSHPSPSYLQQHYALMDGFGAAASPAKVLYQGLKIKPYLSEHTFVSFGCTLSGITCLPRQTRSCSDLHRPRALL